MGDFAACAFNFFSLPGGEGKEKKGERGLEI